jgi:hypothetical protein
VEKVCVEVAEVKIGLKNGGKLEAANTLSRAVE